MFRNLYRSITYRHPFSVRYKALGLLKTLSLQFEEPRVVQFLYWLHYKGQLFIHSLFRVKKTGF